MQLFLIALLFIVVLLPGPHRMLARILAVVVCLSVCLSQVGVLLKWLNVGLHKQCHTIAQGL